MITRKTFDPAALTAINITLQLYAVYWFWFNLTPNVAALTLILLVFIGSISVSMFAHRAWTHKAWVPSQATNNVGLFLHTILLTGTSIGWVAVHRKHHRFVDTPNDPHSPYFQSRWRSHFLSTNADVNLWRYAPDLVRQSNHMWFANYYWYINAGWLLSLYLISPVVVCFWIAFVGLNLFGMHTVNSLAHNSPWWMFPINYERGAANSFVHCLLTLGNGECWHANHHNRPDDWKLGRRWYEIDLGAMLISCLIKLKLGTDRQERLRGD